MEAQTHPSERQEIHIAQINVGNDPCNWWDITLNVLLQGETPVQVTVTDIKHSP